MSKIQEERCESCFRKFAVGTMVPWKNDMVCIACLAYHTARTKNDRCFKCNKLWLPNVLANVNGDMWCLSCRETLDQTPVFQKQVGEKVYADKHADKSWYAVAVNISDLKAKCQISKYFKVKNLSHLLGRIVIPRVKQTKVTKNSYEVISHEGKVIGKVSAADHEEALITAKERFENRKGGRGSFKPDNTVEELEGVIKIKVGRKVAFSAMSRSGKLLGIIYEKTEKKALAVATKLYKDKKDQGPRSVITQFVDVTEVRLVKEGGREIEQNVRAMPGYILVQLTEDATAFEAVKSATRGIVLPFTEKMTYEDIEDLMEEGEEFPKPTKIPNSEVRRLIEPQEKVVPIINYEIGQTVKITGGNWAGMQTRIDYVTSTKIGCIVSMLGRNISIEVEKTNISGV